MVVGQKALERYKGHSIFVVGGDETDLPT
jgi:hypothetical protein